MTEIREISQEKLAEIKESFAFFDRDDNNEIDIDEFAKLLKVISPQATREQAEKGFAFIDENNDGHIDFEEFIGWWQTCWWEY
ncbi:EF-hand domain-containing protein [Aliikangiella coralliicola]|uniref:EF-hand domain-containing protein n=1 Tax=Aliikangiella coralliicola TaxID=2592383 RepID=A0A545U4S1_9GAMM|nr:EF-hand domain-containing protein [Aliikangiella coralliicola]TQV84403.1 EF-hand domain-containing protein [Aliikangiella coralliicola]